MIGERLIHVRVYRSVFVDQQAGLYPKICEDGFWRGVEAEARQRGVTFGTPVDWRVVAAWPAGEGSDYVALVEFDF